MRIPGLRPTRDGDDDKKRPTKDRNGSHRMISLGPLALRVPPGVKLPGPLERFMDDDARRRNNGKSSDSFDALRRARMGVGSIGKKIKGVGNIQQTLMTNMAVKVVAGAAGTLSGLFLAMLAYKVVGGYQDEMKEARREVQRQHQERKARLAQVRRLLSGPLRSAAKDLRNRLEFILRTPPRRKPGEPPKIRANYFSAHYPDNPNEAVNSTLFRLCRYLHWVEQFQRGVQLEGVSEQDTWQYALDQQLDRVAYEFEVGDDRYDATEPTERLMEVFACAHVRELEQGEAEEDERRESIFCQIDKSLTDAVNAAFKKNDEAQTEVKRRVGLKSAEPMERLSRFPMRLFRDTQVALAEVFGELNTHAVKTGNDSSVGETKVNPHMLYTEFVMKLEEAQLLYERTVEDQLEKGNTANVGDVLAAQQENLQADPWFRWMLPLQLQIRRLAMLQSQTSKLLTRKEARELIAARARLRGVLNGLNGLLSVLDKRLDDPLFNKPKHNVKAFHFMGTSEMKKEKIKGLRKQKSLGRWAKLRQAIPYVAKYKRLPPPPTKQRYIRLLSTDELKAFVRRYKRKAVAGVVSAIGASMFTSLLLGLVGGTVRKKKREPKRRVEMPQSFISGPNEETPKVQKASEDQAQGGDRARTSVVAPEENKLPRSTTEQKK